MEPQKSSSMSNNLESSSYDISGSTYFPKPYVDTKLMSLPSNFMTASVDSAFENSVSSSVYNSDQQAKEDGADKKHDYLSPTQNEDFAALEQHIGDLTQEKFSLKCALEASQVLAESLAAENSSLTDNYNQQALNLRSSELKLEKQLENVQAQISSYRKKMSTLEKDCRDLQSTIDVLKEEKKLLLSKLQKASRIGKPIENLTNKMDVSTCMEDIANMGVTVNSSNQEIHDSAADACSLLMVTEIGHSPLGVGAVNIPRDQMRMIENINALISELSLEKEELVKALTSESSESSRLKELNKELSRKLEVQTQRLELLTSQSMVNENITTKQPDSHTTYENVPYVDEGDEVVETVLGWIMQLFPSGASKRRTSKLL